MTTKTAAALASSPNSWSRDQTPATREDSVEYRGSAQDVVRGPSGRAADQSLGHRIGGESNRRIVRRISGVFGMPQILHESHNRTVVFPGIGAENAVAVPRTKRRRRRLAAHSREKCEVIPRELFHLRKALEE